MNNNIKRLIKAVVNNNIQEAKQYVKIIIKEDTTQVNKDFCRQILNILQTSSMNLVELPHDVKGILFMEDVMTSFNINRYYLSSREESITEEIIGMYETSQKLSEMGIQYLNSLMLHGESGTGKTLFGKYLAYKLQLPFVYMNFANIINSYLGGTAKNIVTSFEFVKKQKCVFMIDEIDAIGIKRGKEDVGEMARITISLMQALDCIQNDIIVIGATNRLDMIDPALLRRFTILHEVIKCSEQEMLIMISKYLNDVGIKYDINNIKEYCQTQKSQAVIISDVVRSIAKSIRTNSELMLRPYN